jgi:putative FmdB family regulatory protein
MPLYEYQCDACGHRFEVIQKFSDARIDTCPKCGGAVQKLFSSPAIQFKGSGWYITDYARAGKSDSGSGASAKSEGKTESSASASESKSEGGGDKTATKSESKNDSKSESKSDAKPASSPSTS